MSVFRFSVACLAIVVGYCWVFLSNGQFYTNTLGGIGCSLAATGLGGWELACWRRSGSGRRVGAVVLIACSLGLAALWVCHLPDAARHQEEFNRRQRERLLQREASVP